MTHAEDSFRLEARSFGANGIFYRQGGHVKVTGIANDWTVDVSGDASSQGLWSANLFTLDDDVDHTGLHDHYRLQLAAPRRVEVPIDSLHKNQSDVPMQMLLQSDGKPVIVGRSGDLSSNADMAIVRFNANGISPDASFGTNGVVTIDFFGGRDSAEAIVQQPDGKLVVGGFARVGNGIVFALARLVP